jgi:hypothetical protein
MRPCTLRSELRRIRRRESQCGVDCVGGRWNRAFDAEEAEWLIFVGWSVWLIGYAVDTGRKVRL